MKNLRRIAIFVAALLACWMVGAGVANAAVPIDDHRYISPYICVEDHTTGSFYPTYVHTAANSWNESPAISVVYVKTGSGVTCASYGYDQNQTHFWYLVQASESSQFNWCIKTYWDLNASGTRHEYGPKTFWNYYRPGCQPDTISGGTNTIATFFTRNIGQMLGGKAWYGGESVSIFNYDRVDLRWAQYHDKTHCNSAMHRRYDAVNCA